MYQGSLWGQGIPLLHPTDSSCLHNWLCPRFSTWQQTAVKFNIIIFHKGCLSDIFGNFSLGIIFQAYIPNFPRHVHYLIQQLLTLIQITRICLFFAQEFCYVHNQKASSACQMQYFSFDSTISEGVILHGFKKLVWIDITSGFHSIRSFYFIK